MTPPQPVIVQLPGSKGFHLSLGLVLGLGVGILFILHLLNRSPAFEAWVAGAKAELASKAVWLKRTKQLAGQAASARQSAAVLALTVARLAHERDSLLQAADTAKAPGAAIALKLEAGARCGAALPQCQQEADSLRRADSLDALRAVAAEQRATTSDSLLKVGIKVHEKHCGWTIIVGGGGGLVAGASGGGTGTGLALGLFGGYGCRP
jgi:hypothetical protein